MYPENLFLSSASVKDSAYCATCSPVILSSEGKTNYGARIKLIELDKLRLVVRITNNHVISQIVKVAPEGDETVISA
ncbi:MAG TPA: hypothetical protein VHO92_10355, partial [Methanobacterium sp.]|nr:hypothetical protein [Methanobacterium sp.]